MKLGFKLNVLTTVLLLLFALQPLFSQQDIENQINILDHEIAKLRQEQMNIISPENFKEAVKELGKAKKDFKRGKKIKDILKELEKTSHFLGEVRAVGEQGNVLFKDLIHAREDALNVQAPEFAAEKFQMSEKQFVNAGKRLEKGDLKGARREGIEAERNYRETELIAIKETTLGRVRTLLKNAKDKDTRKFAPYTTKEAEDLYQQIVEILNNDRYSKDNALSLAKKAEYQAKHAMYLADVVEKLQKDNKNWELLMRDFEDRLNKIAAELDFDGNFEKGFARTEKDVLSAIEALKNENRTLKEEVSGLQQEVAGLNGKVQEYENTVVTELEQKKKWEEKMQKVRKIFSNGEAKVLMSGNQIIIRLYGLSFQSGSTVILPEHFALLTKVMQALREFPGSMVEVAGHTDSIGNDAYNFQLSENRALSVRKYLEANMNISAAMLRSIGYGEDRPIASNETKYGRKTNRRIEILIDLPSGELTQKSF